MSPRTARRVRSLALGVAVAAALGRSRGAETPPFVDVHTHLEPGNPRQSVEAALRAMPAENAVRIVFLPPPFTADDPARYDAELLLPAIAGHEDRLAAFGGGGSLNPMIHEAVRTGDAGPAVRERFRARAEQLLREGAVGFGELAAEHLPGATPYQSAPPDHPLFLLLADIAAEHGVPIDLHMEAVSRATPPPTGDGSPPFPARLTPNLDSFEQLLAHNPRARIIWAHAGWDNTGVRTAALCRRLLQAHPNLYMDVKVDPARLGRNPPLERGARAAIDPEWLRLFTDFPDRFVVGTDQHYPEPATRPQRWQAIVELLEQLPPDVRRRIGTENAARLVPAAARSER